jgi:hypothetical protein
MKIISIKFYVQHNDKICRKCKRESKEPSITTPFLKTHNTSYRDKAQ